MLGAGRVIAIDRLPERLALAEAAGAKVLNYEEADPGEDFKEMTGGLGPDCCIDAVGMEAHGTGILALYDTVKQAIRMETGRPMVSRQAIAAFATGGKVSDTGMYGGFIDKMPMGSFVNKRLTMKFGQTHVQRYLRPVKAQTPLVRVFLLPSRITFPPAIAQNRLICLQVTCLDRSNLAVRLTLLIELTQTLKLSR